MSSYQTRINITGSPITYWNKGLLKIDLKLSIKKYLHIHSFFLISRKVLMTIRNKNFFHIPNEACGQNVLELPAFCCCNSSGFDVSKKKKNCWRAEGLKAKVKFVRSEMTPKNRTLEVRKFKWHHLWMIPYLNIPNFTENSLFLFVGLPSYSTFG